MKRFLASILAVAMILSLAACGNSSKEPEFVLSNMWGATCHTDKMKSYLADSVENVTKYATGTSENSRPNSYTFKWDLKKANKYKIKSYTFILAADPVLSDVLFTCELGADQNTVSIDNLYLEKLYYWGVLVTLEDGTSFSSESQEFLTDGAAPRVINVPGVTNCRDLGGWKIEGSSKSYVKQGMIYRTGRMNENKKDTVTIKEEGIKVLRDQLGIKTEIDFRQEEIRSSSALGDAVKYINIPMSGNDVYKNQDNLVAGVKQFFSIIADEKNYPIQIHCSVGTDRTGYLSFLVNGLLGVSEEDLYRDYLFSNFGNIDSMRKADDISKTYVAKLMAEEGEKLSDKIYNYLIKIGVTEDEIKNVRSILTEER